MRRAAVLAAALLMAAAGCGSDKTDVQQARDELALAVAIGAVHDALAGRLDGDPVALTRRYVAIAAEQDVSEEELLDEAASLSASGCERCAEIVSDAAGDG